MATRERRLAEFNGNGEPPPDQPVQVLCEDHSGTYQLPFAVPLGRWRMAQQRIRQHRRGNRGGLAPAALLTKR